MREKFDDAFDRMAGDAGKDIVELSERVDVNALAGNYEAAQHGSRPSADITAEKHLIATTNRDAANGNKTAHVIGRSPE